MWTKCTFLLSLLALCSSDGYWDIELSPHSITTVPFGPGHISVWEHATTKGRYYAMPLVRLLHDSAEIIENILTGETELEFKILMWSLEAREAVFRHLKTNTNKALTESQVELLPMEKIRIVWKDHVRPLASYFSLANEWRSNTDLPAKVGFQFVCRDAAKCKALHQVRRYEAVQSIKVRVGGEPQTPSLTPQLVKAQLEALVKQQIAAQVQAREKLQKEVVTFQSGVDNRLTSLSKMFDSFSGYCRRVRVSCSGHYRELEGRSPNNCKDICNAEAQCMSFTHMRVNGGKCLLYNFKCSSLFLQEDTPRGPGGILGYLNGVSSYYVKMSRVPAITAEMWKTAFTNGKLNTSLDPCGMLDKDYKRN